MTGTYVDPKTARTTVAEWCSTWLAGYATRRPRTVRQARVHVAQITAAFGPVPLSAVRPSSVGSWTVELNAAGLVDSSAAVARWGGDHVVTDGAGRQTSTWAIERATGLAVSAAGLDVKVVQHRLRHGSAKATLDTYGHLWPDSEESARAAVGAVLAARGDWLGTERAGLR